MFLFWLIIALGYVFLITISFWVFVNLGIGVDEYEVIEDGYSGSALLAVFWVVTIPLMLMLWLSKKIVDRIMGE